MLNIVMVQLKFYRLIRDVKKDEKGNETKTFGIQVKSDTSYGLGASIKYAFQKFGSVYDSMVTSNSWIIYW